MPIPRLSNESIINGTGKSWDEWVTLLDSAGGREWPHEKIAKWLHDEGHEPKPWWNRAVTIGYEQAIGRREVGQNCTGDTVVSASKTVNGDMDLALELWTKLVSDIPDFNSVPLVGQPRISETPKWRYWRANLADGSNVNVNISAKTEAKSSLGLEHSKIADPETVTEWKTFWKALLATLG